MNLTSVKILIVDDNSSDRLLYRIHLSENNLEAYTFAEAEAGAAGLELCATYHPDCILLDYKLPDLDGLEFLDTLKSSPGGLPCPVIMLTGMGDERIAVSAMKLGAADYVPKADVATVLPRAVPSAIDRFRLQRQLENQRTALGASEMRYRTLLEAMPQLVWVTGTDGEIQYANRRLADYFGDSIHTLKMQVWQDALHPEDRERSYEAWRLAQEKREAFEVEQRLRRAKDGVYRWHLVRGIPLDADAGADMQWFGTCTDIQSRKEAEEAMLESQKWESLGQLAGGIAHDFNNLLTIVVGGATYASSRLDPQHALQPIIRNIATAGEQAAQLTGQMLAYAGKGRFYLQRVNLGAVAADTGALLSASIAKGIAIRIETPETPVFVEADAGQMQQVVMNLVMNAAEAIGADRQGFVELTVGRQDGQVLLQVHDSGAGIDPAAAGKVFDPFFSTKGSGRGLGLAAVQGIVRRMKGSIEVESRPGEGATFRVLLPAAAPDVETVQPNCATAARDAESQPEGRTVLVIDDEHAVREIAQTCLENAGYCVLTAESGPAGLEALKSHPEVACVLLDSGMPVMSGKDVLQQVRSAGNRVPVIVCSGYSEDESAQRFADLQVSAFLKKPFTLAGLVEAVDQVVNPSSR